MDYYAILNLKKEPFSNSPEPEFLFQLPPLTDCLQKLELAVRLRRGLNVVIGDVGTGKTTLCRKLIQILSATAPVPTEIETHLLLDPDFNSPFEFLQTFALMLGIRDAEKETSEWHLKEKIKNNLFDKGVDEKKIVVLLIDEGQKIPGNCLEILREFLNYETNEFKLLQIIIFAQKEFLPLLKKRTNLLDRVHLLYYLKPLTFRQMCAMINYRLQVAAEKDDAPAVFSFLGFLAVYLVTWGYPRKIVFLCHQVILKMIVRGQKKAGWMLVRSCWGEKEKAVAQKWQWALTGSIMILLAGASIMVILQRQNADAQKVSEAVPSAHYASAVQNRSIGAGSMPPSAPVTIEPSEDSTMPDHLGEITMTKRRTIWWTLYNIYGDTGSDIVSAVVAANPHIRKNINVIGEGEKITLPFIPVMTKSDQRKKVFVALKTGKDLEKMYNVFRNSPDEQMLLPLAFFSFWNKKNGLEFAIVVDKCYTDVNAAEAEIGRLPPSAAAEAKILADWGEDTVFFNRRLAQN
jgi:general secretion pathway protein A